MEDVIKNFTKFNDGLKRGDTTILAIAGSLLLIFLTTVIFFIRSRSNKRRDLLLLGLCDSGKTLLFTNLVHGKFKETYTSMSLNSGIYYVSSKKKDLKVVDLPGFERLRYQLLDQWKSQARAIIYMIDSGSFQKDMKDVAEFLYNVLADKVISNNATPVLVACNKQDQTVAKGSKVIQAQLEKEINLLRVTRSAALQGTDNSGSNQVYLGKKNKDFQFSDLRNNKLRFIECSLKKKESESDPEMNKLIGWLSDVA